MIILLRSILPLVFLLSLSLTSYSAREGVENSHFVLVSVVEAQDPVRLDRLVREEGLRKKDKKTLQALQRVCGSRGKLFSNLESYFKEKRKLEGFVLRERHQSSCDKFRHGCCVWGKRIGVLSYTAFNVAATVSWGLGWSWLDPENSVGEAVLGFSVIGLAGLWLGNCASYCPRAFFKCYGNGGGYGEGCCCPFKGQPFQEDSRLLKRMRESTEKLSFVNRVVDFVEELYLEGEEGKSLDIFYEAYQEVQAYFKEGSEILSKEEYRAQMKQFFQSKEASSLEVVLAVSLDPNSLKEEV